MVDDEIRRIARLLESLVKVEKVPVRELERRLELGGGTLNRIFNGKIELKLRHILLVLEALEIRPLAFFDQAFRARDGEEEQRAAWLLDAVENLRRRPSPPEPDAGAESLSEPAVRRIVVDVLRELGVAAPPSGGAPKPGKAGNAD